MISNYKYMLEHFNEYNSGLTKAEFIRLLNILEYNGECYETFYEAIFNGYTEFCGIWHNGGTWDTQRELFETLEQFHSFFTFEELNKYLWIKAEDILDDAESIQEVHELFNEELNEYIPTTDGYIKRYDY